MGISSSIRFLIDLPMILIIITSPLLPAAFSAGNQFRASICSGNYTHPGTRYSQNLRYLMTVLANSTPSNHGFSNATWAQVSEDRSYGLALCRGDISNDNKSDYCRDCLAEAVANINCSHNRAAIIWYDYCLLKYSDQGFFGQIDTDNNYYMCSGNSANDTFVYKIKDLLNKLAGEAANQTDTMFSNGTETYEREVIYGMVQCTRDLPVENCTGCLRGAMEDISSYCLPKTSGNFFYGSCVARYDTSPFLI